jgi:hypothetical protein
MSDVEGVSGSREPRFEPITHGTKGDKSVSIELDNLFEQNKEAYKSGNWEQLQMVANRLTDYLERPDVRDQLLKQVPPNQSLEMEKSIAACLEANGRIQDLASPPTGLPLDAHSKDPLFSTAIAKALESMRAQVAQRNAFYSLLHLVDPQKYQHSPRSQ